MFFRAGLVKSNSMHRSRKKIWIIAAAAIVIIIGIWGYFSSRSGGDRQDYFVVVRQNLAEIVTEVGKVTPVQEIDLTFALQGRIASINVKEGEQVARGAVLASLDTTKVKADFEKANAAVREAQARLDKLKAGATAAEKKFPKPR